MEIEFSQVKTVSEISFRNAHPDPKRAPNATGLGPYPHRKAAEPTIITQPNQNP